MVFVRIVLVKEIIDSLKKILEPHLRAHALAQWILVTDHAAKYSTKPIKNKDFIRVFFRNFSGFARRLRRRMSSKAQVPGVQFIHVSAQILHAPVIRQHVVGPGEPLGARELRSHDGAHVVFAQPAALNRTLHLPFRRAIHHQHAIGEIAIGAGFEQERHHD